MRHIDVTTLLGADGPFAGLIEGYVEREEQIRMAHDVGHAIESRATLLAEAGTGTGKSYAYLVPALLASGRTIISTGTRTLQDQLYYKDLPVVREALATTRKVALLKGRANYLCPYRLDKHLKVIKPGTSNEIVGELGRVREWYSSSRTGDITEVLDTEAESGLIPLITSTVDNCLGSECPRIDECPLYIARRRANEADVIVVNHHLLFADIALQDDNLPSLLPGADAVIVDESHQLADVARQFFGLRLGSGQITDLCRDVRNELALLGNDDRVLAGRVGNLERATLALLVKLRELHGRSSFADMLASGVLADAIDDMDHAIAGLLESLDVAAVRSQALAKCHQRAARLIDRFAMLTETVSAEVQHAHWLELHDKGFVIHLTPVSVAAQFGAHVRESGQAWVMTSATLTVNGSFDHIVEGLGLEHARLAQYESPFDYATQVKAWLPEALPNPGDDIHTGALVEACLPILQAVRGRTFFLFTSYRALNTAAQCLRSAGVRFLAQGQMSRAMLLERFRSTERAVLLATHSFWEGVDVRGADLHCLIIDKLPFASPDDAISSACVRALETKGANGFLEYLVPEAAISLRQGFGRLVREESDRGIFILGDPRVATKGYGKLFIASLPAMEWTRDQADAVSYVSSLAVR